MNVQQNIEKYGVMMEAMGMSPMASRIYIYLLCTAEGRSDFAGLVEYFGASKSAVSNALKSLTDMKLVVSTSVDGRRKRTFAANLTGMLDPGELTRRFVAFSGMLDDIRRSRGKDDALSRELSEISGFYNFMVSEFPKILARWKKMPPTKV